MTQLKNATTKSLRHRHYHLTKAVERIRQTLAEIDAELMSRGVEPTTHRVCPRQPLPGIRTGEMASICMTVLRAATEPIMSREIAMTVAKLRGFNQADDALMARVIERTSSAMEALARRKTIRIAGNPRLRKGARWVLTGSESES